MKNLASFLTHLIVVPVMVAAGVAACGGGQGQPPAAPAAPSATPAATATAPAGEPASATPVPSSASGGKSWTDMSHEERLNLMKSEVTPKMKAAFQEFDANDFKDFSCATCHGERARHGNFAMPNPALPHLDSTNEFAKHKAKSPKMLDFMFKTVSPGMANILGLPGYDPATHKGFGCGGCHVFDK